ncbi:hypothetical protein [Pantoea sp. CFSAN033090]|uniref:hypothetical protein n=1 Tax=Pantoea sp. CFSAN033090 TaxID=1690502 RepID=UPI00068B4BB0|nr:hypothetical protein [Pantoea sp. CFSAN033090]KOA70482.1 hypothetical protein AFL22_11245 [Pantoea sp. CFSAN033090]
MSDKKYPSNLYLESVTTSVDFASHVSVEAVIVMAKELLALRKGREIPEGWKLVPVEPTEEMIAAGDQFMDGLSRLGDAYDAMLAAAPEVE